MTKCQLNFYIAFNTVPPAISSNLLHIHHLKGKFQKYCFWTFTKFSASLISCHSLFSDSHLNRFGEGWDDNSGGFSNWRGCNMIREQVWLLFTNSIISEIFSWTFWFLAVFEVMESWFDEKFKKEAFSNAKLSSLKECFYEYKYKGRTKPIRYCDSHVHEYEWIRYF